MSGPAVVLVHGGFVDGSGWRGVYDALSDEGYRTVVVQNPTLSLAGDVAATRWVLDSLDGPVVLVGHSDGGAVISEAGTHPGGCRARLHHRVRPRCGGVRQHTDRRPSARSAGPADPAAARGIPAARRVEVPRILRRRSNPRGGAVPCRITGPLGRRRARRRDHRAGLAIKAELVSGRDRRQDDPATRAACDGGTGRRYDQRSAWQPCDLRVKPGRRRRRHPPRRQSRHSLNPARPMEAPGSRDTGGLRRLSPRDSRTHAHRTSGKPGRALAGRSALRQCSLRARTVSFWRGSALQMWTPG